MPVTTSVTAQVATQYEQGQTGHFANSEDDDESIIIKSPIYHECFGARARGLGQGH
jgi:hypothetical protein